MAIFSNRLFSAPAFSGGPTLQYAAPVGTTVVVHTISIVWGVVLITGLDAWVQLQDLTKLCRVTRIGLPPPDPQGGTVVFPGRWVLAGGDTLSAQTGVGTCDIFCSGYVLTP